MLFQGPKGDVSSFLKYKMEGKEIWYVMRPGRVQEAVRRKVFISVPLGSERSSLPVKVID
jgi:hypothetical protein